MKRQRSVSQGSLSRMFQETAEAWKRQDYQQAIETLQRAARLDPANVSLLLDLGRAHGLRYDYSEAGRYLDKAVRLATRKAEVSAEAGQRCQEFGSYEMARRYLEQAVNEKAAPASALVAIAELNERHAKLETAIEFIERALGRDAGHSPARLVRARLERLSGRLNSAEDQVRAVLNGGEKDPWVRARGYYELGEILDRQSRYDEAFEAFLEAKALVRPLATKHAATLAGIQARVREMEGSITSSVLERWAEAGQALQPQRRFSVLCGHPRSGTTLLEQVLDSHPEIVCAEETHILHDEAYLLLSRGFAPECSVLEVLESAPVSQLLQSRDNYFRYTALFLNRSLGDKMLVDKNPALNVLIPAVARIFPEAKFLVALRDPRDVCLSCFMQPLSPNPVSSAYLSLEGTVTQYLSVMGFWRTILPRLHNPFLEVRYEELVENLESVSRRALEFLGVAWDERVIRFDEHARSKPLRSPSYAEVTKPVNKRAVGRWQNYQRHLEPYLRRLDPMLKVLGYS
jgi:tetratricopeptide (TPR) repeat protein